MERPRNDFDQHDSQRSVGRVARGLWVAVLVAAAGCQRAEAPATRIDLLQLFPFTVSGRQAQQIDLGSAGASVYLDEGWSPRRVLSSGEAVVGAAQRRAVLHFDVQDVADRRLVVRCRRSPTTDASPAQPVVVRLNNNWLESFLPQHEFQDMVVALPAAAQRQGRNRLELSHRGMSRRPPKNATAMASVDYQSLRFERVDGVIDTPFLGPGERPQSLVLPAPSRVDYFVHLPTSPLLLFEQEGADNVSVSALIQAEGTVPKEIWRQRGTAVASIDLAPFAGQVVKLSLAAEGQGLVQLVQPRLASPPDPPAPRGASRPDGFRPPNIILYIIDTLRSDHLGSYGYASTTSPNIDALAETSILFTHMQAQSSWTRPSTASIMTGVFPFTHGALRLKDSLRPDIPTLAEILRGQGYETAAFVTNVNVSRPFGFHRGFERFTYLPEDEKRESMHVLAADLHRALQPWLAEEHARPFFLYVHATDPHTPYTPLPPFERRFLPAGLTPTVRDAANPLKRMLADPELVTPDNIRYVASLYDGEIASIDEQFGNLLEELKRLRLYDSTLIVLTSDHGEEFDDHGGFEHGRTLYRELLSVPLLMRMPGGRQGGTRDTALARQVDILPTILGQAGVAVPQHVQGQDLLAHDRSEEPSFAQTSMSAQMELEAVTSVQFKAVRRRSQRGNTIALYDRTTDPTEHRDVAAQHPILVQHFTQELERCQHEGRDVGAGGGEARRAYADEATVDAAPLDDATIDRLRMLGYAP